MVVLEKEKFDYLTKLNVLNVLFRFEILVLV
jgi:hypothetical protein